MTTKGLSKQEDEFYNWVPTKGLSKQEDKFYNWVPTEGLSTKENEFYNWVHNVLALNSTKAALHRLVLMKWTEEIDRWGIKSLNEDVLIKFLCEVEDGKVTLNKSDKSKNWKCLESHTICERIINCLMDARQNKSFRLNCRTGLGRKLVKKEVVESDASRVFQVMTGKSPPRNDKPMPQHGNKHIWCIANMFMKSESFKNEICNTCPADSDAAMFFRMMKNCKLFDLEGDKNLYQEVIDIRNKLHRSSVMLVKKQESEANLDTLKKLLELFSIDVYKIDEVKHQTHCLGNVKKAIFLKAFALETDRKIEEGKGFYSEETKELQVEALDHFKYTSLEQFLSIKSKEDLKRENHSYHQQFINLTTDYTYTEMDDLQEELKRRTQKLEDTKIKDKLVIAQLLAKTRHVRCELADLSGKRFKLTGVTKVVSSRDENIQIVEKLREEIKETRKQISDLRKGIHKEEETIKPGVHKSAAEKEEYITFDIDEVDIFNDKSTISPRRKAISHAWHGMTEQASTQNITKTEYYSQDANETTY